MLFKTIRSQMIITSLRCMPLKLDRRIENDPPSFCSCGCSIREKMRGVPHGRILRSLSSLIGSLPKRPLD